jgi:ribose 5-phosphate isomerase RpiB
MSAGNGQATDVLHWPGRVLAADDVRRRLNGQRRLVLGPATVVTPLAIEELRQKRVEVVHDGAEPAATPAGVWGVGQDRAYPLVHSALQTLARERVPVRALPEANGELPCRWAKAVAECVARGECAGGVLFCAEPELVCCVANKVGGLRAAAALSVAQAARAVLNLGANLLVVEMPGRTFFEVRQILRELCAGARRLCPDGVACTLRELDGHAHR